MAAKYTICVILLIKLFLFFWQGTKAQQQYIQSQSQSTHQGQVGQQFSRPGSSGHSHPLRTPPAAIYLQQQNMSNFYKKFTRHLSVNRLVCLDIERSWEQVLSLFSGFYLEI